MHTVEDEVLLSDLLGLERWWLIFSNGSSCLTLTLGAKNRSRAKESRRKYYPVSQQRLVHCGNVCLSLAELQLRSWYSWLENTLCWRTGEIFPPDLGFSLELWRWQEDESPWEHQPVCSILPVLQVYFRCWYTSGSLFLPVLSLFPPAPASSCFVICVGKTWNVVCCSSWE